MGRTGVTVVAGTIAEIGDCLADSTTVNVGDERTITAEALVVGDGRKERVAISELRAALECARTVAD